MCTACTFLQTTEAVAMAIKTTRLELINAVTRALEVVPRTHVNHEQYAQALANAVVHIVTNQPGPVVTVFTSTD
jgi:Rad3-related DNA helicase